MTKKGALGFSANGTQYAGTHLFIDLWGANNTSNAHVIKRAILAAVEESGATLLESGLSEYGEHAGVTAFAILAESHICVNTWSEERMVAIDIFFCAGLDPYRCVPAFKKVFQPQRIQISEHKRLLASSLTHSPSEMQPQ